MTAVLEVLLLGMAAMTWTFTFRNGQASIRELAGYFGRLSMRDIRQHLQGYLAVPSIINDINSFPFSTDLEGPPSADAFARRFSAELNRFDSVISIAYANEDGEYLGVARDTGGVPRSLALSDASTGRRLVGYRSDAQGTRGAEFDRSPDPFDSRLRPWYTTALQAGEPAWTPVYLWLSGEAGIDLVAPVRDRAGVFRGVLDTSLTLDGIGRFLQGVRATPRSEAFIVERSGLLVGASAAGPSYRRSGAILQRLSGLESGNPLIRAATERILSAIAGGETLSSERQFSLDFERARHVLLVDRFADTRGLDWYFAEVIPEAELAQPIIDDMRSTAVAVGLFVLAAAGVGLLIARWISRPLRQLTDMAQGMAHGTLSREIPVGGTREVGLLAESFNLMASELRRSFDSLADSERRYRAFVASSSEGILRFEADEPMPVSLPEAEQVEWFYGRFRLAECNDVAAHLLGVERADQVLGRGPEVWLPRGDAASTAVIQRRIHSPSPVSGDELSRTGPDGAVRTFLLSTSAVVDAGRLVRFWAVLRDVSDQRAAEEALRRSEARLRNIFHRSTVSLLEADFSELHAALEDLEARGIRDREEYLRGNRPFLDRALRMIRIVDANESAVELLGAGSLENLLGPLDIRFEEEALAASVPAAIAAAVPGQHRHIETRITTSRGVTRDVIIHFYLPADDDILANMLISVVDITQRTQAEREREALREELRQAQKVETIGRLAGGIAHDINNLLTPLLGGGEILLAEAPAEEHAAAAGQVVGAALRIAELTRKLLAFSRKQKLAPQVVRLDGVVSDFQSLLRRMLRKDVELRFTRSHDAGLVRVDVGQVEQVLMNLAVNAQDAMPGGGTLTLDVRSTEIHAESPRPAGLEPGRYVALTVTDTGTGMDAAVREHLFEPFFTTKERGKGTGLGLSTVHGIVTQHGGHVQVDSDPGWGTRFRILFPRQEEP